MILLKNTMILLVCTLFEKFIIFLIMVNIVSHTLKKIISVIVKDLTPMAVVLCKSLVRYMCSLLIIVDI